MELLLKVGSIKESVLNPFINMGVLYHILSGRVIIREHIFIMYQYFYEGGFQIISPDEILEAL